MRKQQSRLGVLGGPSVLGEVFSSRTGGQSEFESNMESVVVFFNAARPKTDRAARIKDEFAKWHAELTFWDRNWNTDETWAKARNFRNDYNLANATTTAAQQQVERVITGGQTSEQAFNEATKARTTSGQFAEGVSAAGPSTLTWVVVGVAVAGGLYALGKVATLAQVFGGRRAHATNPRSRRS